MDDEGKVLGRGITNSRSNYDTAAAVSKQEALIDARFTLFRRGLEGVPSLAGRVDVFLGDLERHFRHVQYLHQLADLEETCAQNSRGLRFAGRRRRSRRRSARSSASSARRRPRSSRPGRGAARTSSATSPDRGSWPSPSRCAGRPASPST